MHIARLGFLLTSSLYSYSNPLVDLRDMYIHVSHLQGRSQDNIKGALNSADACRVQTQIHYLTKHLHGHAPGKDNAHHPVAIYIIIHLYYKN